MVLERTKTAVQEGRLYRCLVCRALCELNRAEEKWPSNNSAMCSPYFQNFKKIQESNLSHQGNHEEILIFNFIIVLFIFCFGINFCIFFLFLNVYV